MLISRSRLISALLAVVVAGAALVGLPLSAQAAVVSSCTNSGCPDPTNWSDARWDAHAGYPSNGGTLDGMNCTNYVAWRLMKTQGFSSSAVSGLGNASTWDTRAASKGYTVDRKASVGAVAQWDSNHVAYVEQVNGDGTIVISESNTWMGDPSQRKWLRHRVVTASGVDHFIHFLPAEPSAAKTVLAPGDFDGDGFPDLMVVLADGRLMLFRGDGAGGFLSTTGTKLNGSWSGYKRVFTVGDFTGDGHTDLMGIARDGKLYLMRGTGTKLETRTQVGSGWEKRRFAFSPGDFTGDGKTDVLTVQADGKLVLYAGGGKGGWKSGTRPTLATGFGAAVLVGSPGDVDGDGKADVIAVWKDGTVKLYPGNGKGALRSKTGTVIASGWAGVSGFEGRGDFTGDALADLVLLRADGKLALSPGDGSTFGTGGPALGVTW